MGQLLDDMHAGSRLRRMECSIAVIRRALTGQDLVDFDAALKNPRVTNASIARVMNARGFDLIDQTVSRHRRGDCRCARAA